MRGRVLDHPVVELAAPPAQVVIADVTASDVANSSMAPGWDRVIGLVRDVPTPNPRTGVLEPAYAVGGDSFGQFLREMLASAGS